MTYEYIGRRERALYLLGRALDHGYSLRHIEGEQFLAELRKDPRYGVLVGERKVEETDCDAAH
jgi:hypothetical protein